MTPKRSADPRGAVERARWRPRDWTVVAVTTAIAAGMLLGTTGEAPADKIIYKSGAEVTGKVVAETKDKVVFAMPKYGPNVRMEVPRADIRAVIRDGSDPTIPAAPTPTTAPATQPADVLPSAPEKTYYPIPIVGEIGKEVLAKTLEVALQDAQKARPDYIVFYIDSGGGSVSETREILEVLSMVEGPRMVAFVKQALSAAAIITLTCPDIYMSPTAVIGGAVPYQVGPEGTPKDVEEKFKSVIRAQFRAAADLGGHPTVLVKAMMDPNMQLFLIEKDGKKTLAAAGPGKLLKDKNKVLAMTAKEAVDAGVAKGRARRMANLHTAMELESWARVEGKGWDIMAGQANAAKRQEMLKEQAEAVAEQRKNISPEIIKINNELTRIGKDLRLANSEMKMMENEYNREVGAINAEYERQRRQARILGLTGKGQERANLLRNAERNRENGLNNLVRQFEPRTRAVKLRVQNYLEQQKVLVDKKRRLIRTGAP